jgi:hypothetical protein
MWTPSSWPEDELTPVSRVSVTKQHDCYTCGRRNTHLEPHVISSGGQMLCSTCWDAITFALAL